MMNSKLLQLSVLLLLTIGACKNKDRSDSCLKYSLKAGSTENCEVTKILDPVCNINLANQTMPFSDSDTLDMNGDAIPDLILYGSYNDHFSSHRIEFLNAAIQTQADPIGKYDNDKELEKETRKSLLMARAFEPGGRLCEKANWEYRKVVYFFMNERFGPNASIDAFDHHYLPLRIGTDNYGWLEMSFAAGSLTIHSYAFEKTF